MLSRIFIDVFRRLERVGRHASASYTLLLGILACFTPLAHAGDNTPFHVPNELPPQMAADIAEDIRKKSGWLSVPWWDNRGQEIRRGDRGECWGNLSYALGHISLLDQAEYSGAASALALLPTAGALIGAPIKDMWYIYKLVPLAGASTMLLSLGGNLIPSSVHDYDASSTFSYAGLKQSKSMSSIQDSSGRPRQEKRTQSEDNMDPASHFAKKVQARARVRFGGVGYSKVWAAMGCQLALIVVNLLAMWYGQLGGVVMWWCTTWGWMYTWYALTAATSLFDNMTAGPFAKSWTMRVSRAPPNLIIPNGATKVKNIKTNNAKPQKVPVLDSIHQGINSKIGPIIDKNIAPEQSRSCFYVVVSREGTNVTKTTLQTLARCANATVFTFGTTIFASVSLMSVSVALMVLSVTLSAGLLGRVAAMWIATSLSQSADPVIHAVVSSDNEASEFVEKILDIEGLMVEMSGYIFLEGKAVHWSSEWFHLSRYIGLLAPPFDIERHAANRQALIHGHHVQRRGSLLQKTVRKVYSGASVEGDSQYA